MIIYPGTFDPITNGHKDIIDRSLKIFDGITIAVAESKQKKTLFPLEVRLKFVKKIFENEKNITVISFSGLLKDLLIEKKIFNVLRGIRSVADYEFEFQLANMNKKLDKKIETVFMIPNENYSSISSSIVREVINLKGDISKFVPNEVIEYLKKNDT
tara:strand:+ start:10 stop:480 length:471 start_codon:yes stop_codon:yes gene_type:complete